MSVPGTGGESVRRRARAQRTPVRPRNNANNDRRNVQNASGPVKQEAGTSVKGVSTRSRQLRTGMPPHARCERRHTCACDTLGIHFQRSFDPCANRSPYTTNRNTMISQRVHAPRIGTFTATIVLNSESLNTFSVGFRSMCGRSRTGRTKIENITEDENGPRDNLSEKLH